MQHRGRTEKRLNVTALKILTFYQTLELQNAGDPCQVIVSVWETHHHPRTMSPTGIEPWIQWKLFENPSNDSVFWCFFLVVCSLWRTSSTSKRLNTNAQLRKSTCWKNSLRGNNRSLMNVMTCYFRPLDKTPLCDTKSSFKTSFIVATISASFLFSILTPVCQLIPAIVARYLLLYLTEVFDSFFLNIQLDETQHYFINLNVGFVFLFK